MISSDYVSRAMTGVYRVSIYDAKGLSWFEINADGFFRSFWAIGLSFPLYAYSVLGTVRAAQNIPDPDGKPVTIFIFVLLHVLFFLGSCFAFLIAMWPLSRLLALPGRYSVFVITYNWGTFAYHLAATIPVLAFGLGLLNSADAIWLWLIAAGLACYMRFAIIATTMGAPWPIAAALATMDPLLQFLWFLILRSVLT